MKPLKKAAEMTKEELARYIDHSVLKPEFTVEEAEKIIKDGVRFGCKAVCVQGSNVAMALNLVKGSETLVAACVGFPQGVSTSEVKCYEAEHYCRLGAHEIDMVANYGWIRSGMYHEVTEEIRKVADICHRYNVALKVILETDALTTDQITKGVECCIEGKADYAKTSTGFLTGYPNAVGASTDVVKIIMDAAQGRIKVKGAGAIRTREHFLQLIDMGIDRMGVGYKSTPLVLGIDETVSAGNEAY